MTCWRRHIDLAANLTRTSPVEVTTKCLEAGKHVFSETDGDDCQDAAGLVALAKRKGLRGRTLHTHGRGQQTTWKLVREGPLGTVRVAFARSTGGASVVASCAGALWVGALYDVSVYP
jgi:predicted dehydrogenase